MLTIAVITIIILALLLFLLIRHIKIIWADYENKEIILLNKIDELKKKTKYISETEWNYILMRLISWETQKEVAELYWVSQSSVSRKWREYKNNNLINE